MERRGRTGKGLNACIPCNHEKSGRVQHLFNAEFFNEEISSLLGGLVGAGGIRLVYLTKAKTSKTF